MNGECGEGLCKICRKDHPTNACQGSKDEHKSSGYSSEKIIVTVRESSEDEQKKEEIEKMTPEEKVEYLHRLETMISNSTLTLLNKKMSNVATESGYENPSDGRMNDKLTLSGTDGFFVKQGLRGLAWDFERGWGSFFREGGGEREDFARLIAPKGVNPALRWREYIGLDRRAENHLGPELTWSVDQDTGTKDKFGNPVFKPVKAFDFKYDKFYRKDVTFNERIEDEKMMASPEKQSEMTELIFRLQSIAESLGDKRKLRLTIERPLEDFSA